MAQKVSIGHTAPSRNKARCRQSRQFYFKLIWVLGLRDLMDGLWCSRVALPDKPHYQHHHRKTSNDPINKIETPFLNTRLPGDRHRQFLFLRRLFHACPPRSPHTHSEKAGGINSRYLLQRPAAPVQLYRFLHPLSIHISECYQLHHSVVINAVKRAFTAKTRFLHAAKW